MDQPSLPTPKRFVRELGDGEQVESVFLVREAARREKKNGEPFLKLQLGDVTGAVEAVVWENVEEAAACATSGSIVACSGSFALDKRYGPCLTVRGLRRAEAQEYDPRDLLDGPMIALDRMVADLRELIGTVQHPHLCALLERFFAEDSELWARWSEAPAAKRYHQAYRHGLFEHCLSVAQGVHVLASTFPGIDHDVAVAGALLHDVGKIEAYAIDGGAIELTDLGKLHGEIPLGYYLVRREIEELPGFPAATAQALLHIILSHHGQLEHGSPVVPCTREATLVHFVDNLGGKLGSFDRIEKSLSSGQAWSGFDRALAGAAYFAARNAEIAA